MKERSTYTFAALKDSVYQALDAFSENGERVSVSSGEAADTERRFLQTLNQCLRRVCMSLPLLEKRVQLTFTSIDGESAAVLPEDFFKALAFSPNGNRKIGKTDFTVREGRLFCRTAAPGSVGILDYTAAPVAFTAETPPEQPIGLPDITADALVYLTAAELCPVEDSERYTRLLYRYRDIALNVYNVEGGRTDRNTFYKAKPPRRLRKDG